ncbi:hypothetical protein [Haloarcula litorea]|uniref:hypothetical protein n=1 Tax=Haloarcula litorea TaxID=3032579 RepID=UPI0023E88719|nr:hypothetical protein [Halomicroarcula sp. GDY20]
MIDEFNGVHLKAPRDGRVLDSVLRVVESGGTATTSTVLEDVRILDDNKQVLRAFDRLEDAGLIEIVEDADIEWDRKVPAPTVVQPTDYAHQFKDDLRVPAEEIEEEMDEKQLRELAREVREELEKQRKINEQLRARLGEIEEFIDALAEEVEDVSETAEEADERSKANKDRLRDPDFGFEFD